MDTRKKGDHLVATGLAKTIGDMALMIEKEIGNCSEGRVLYGAVSRCSKALTGGTYDAAINKGRPAPFEDRHSIEFGNSVRTLKLSMTSLITALKSRREIDVKDPRARTQELTYWNECIATAKASAILATGHFVDAAIDGEVERRVQAKLKDEIAVVRTTLEWIRVTMCDGIRKM